MLTKKAHMAQQLIRRYGLRDGLTLPVRLGKPATLQFFLVGNELHLKRATSDKTYSVAACPNQVLRALSNILPTYQTYRYLRAAERGRAQADLARFAQAHPVLLADLVCLNPGALDYAWWALIPQVLARSSKLQVMANQGVCLQADAGPRAALRHHLHRKEAILADGVPFALVLAVAAQEQGRPYYQPWCTAPRRGYHLPSTVRAKMEVHIDAYEKLAHQAILAQAYPRFDADTLTAPTTEAVYAYADFAEVSITPLAARWQLLLQPQRLTLGVLLHTHQTPAGWHKALSLGLPLRHLCLWMVSDCSLEAAVPDVISDFLLSSFPIEEIPSDVFKARVQHTLEAARLKTRMDTELADALVVATATRRRGVVL